MTDSAHSSDLSTKAKSLLQQGVTGAFLGSNAVSQSNPTPPSNQQSLSSQQLDTSGKLDILEEVLADYPALATAEVRAQVQSPAQPTASSGPRKESLEVGGISPIETGATVQQVEPEKSPEIPPEVDKFIKQTQQLEGQKTKEVVIAEATDDLPDQASYQSQPVIVLPITPEVEKKGVRKSPKFSVRWLVEWSKKVIKMFAGKVIYRSA